MIYLVLLNNFSFFFTSPLVGEVDMRSMAGEGENINSLELMDCVTGWLVTAQLMG